MDGSLPSSSLHGILQVRILEWFSISFCRGSSWPRDWTQVSCIADKFLTDWATRVALTLCTIPANGFLGYLLGGGMGFSFCFCMSAIKLVISSAIYQWSLVKRTFGSLKINWLSSNTSEKERLLGLRARIWGFCGIWVSGWNSSICNPGAKPEVLLNVQLCLHYPAPIMLSESIAEGCGLHILYQFHSQKLICLWLLISLLAKATMLSFPKHLYFSPIPPQERKKDFGGYLQNNCRESLNKCRS